MGRGLSMALGGLAAGAGQGIVQAAQLKWNEQLERQREARADARAQRGMDHDTALAERKIAADKENLQTEIGGRKDLAGIEGKSRLEVVGKQGENAIEVAEYEGGVRKDIAETGAESSRRRGMYLDRVTTKDGRVLEKNDRDGLWYEQKDETGKAIEIAPKNTAGVGVQNERDWTAALEPYQEEGKGIDWQAIAEGFSTSGNTVLADRAKRALEVAAVKLPESQDADDLIEGKFYVTARGIAKWNGTGFDDPL